MSGVSVVIPTVEGAPRLARLLESLGPADAAVQVIVVANGSSDGTRELVRRRFPHVELVALAENLGYGRAVNLAARRAEHDALLLLNDDCVCERGFCRTIAAALEPTVGRVMAAGVMVEARAPGTIDSAGMILDETLLVSDYLNGEHVSVLDAAVEEPIGPSGAAAAFDRDAFLEAGGFDENLFAYWEDVDLVLRLRLLGATCALAAEARGSHEHSATLGSGSAAKNYLMGFGRGYVLRKWGVLAPARLAAVLARELPICAGQVVVDRNAAGIRGRIDGFARAAGAGREAYPGEVLRGRGRPGLAETLLGRARRRARVRTPVREAR